MSKKQRIAELEARLGEGRRKAERCEKLADLLTEALPEAARRTGIEPDPVDRAALLAVLRHAHGLSSMPGSVDLA